MVNWTMTEYGSDFNCRKFVIEDLGVQECFVYDLGVENNHTFFSNDILLHNSNYICVDAVVKKKFPNGSDDKTITKWLMESLYKKGLKTIIEDACIDIHQYMNTPKQKLVMELEKILSAMLLTDKKKRYATTMTYKDKVWYDKAKLSVTGLESVKSSTPQFARKFLEELYKHICEHDSDVLLRELLDDQYRRFLKMEFDDIAMVTSVNTGLEVIHGDIEDTKPHGMTNQVKACKVHNMYNARKGYSITPIHQNGVKIKYLDLKPVNGISKFSNVIGYIGSFPPEWENDSFLKKQIDVDRIWNVRYIKLVDAFIEFFKWSYNENSLEELI